MPAPILKYFEFKRLPAKLQDVSRPIHDLAVALDATNVGEAFSVGCGKEFYCSATPGSLLELVPWRGFGTQPAPAATGDAPDVALLTKLAVQQEQIIAHHYKEQQWWEEAVIALKNRVDDLEARLKVVESYVGPLERKG